MEQVSMPKASNAVAVATVTWHSDIPLTRSTVILTYKSVFNPLLRNPAQTHVLYCNCLPLLYFELQFPKVYTSQSMVFNTS